VRLPDLRRQRPECGRGFRGDPQLALAAQASKRGSRLLFPRAGREQIVAAVERLRRVERAEALVSQRKTVCTFRLKAEATE
jgi:hypothetical protein